MERVNVTLGDGEESLLVLLSVAMSGAGATMSHTLGHRRGRPPAPGSPAGPRHLRRALRRPGLRAAAGWRETRSPRLGPLPGGGGVSAAGV